MNFAGEVVLLIFGGVGLGLVYILMRGFVLSMLWGWIMVPTFGAPPLSIAAALGIALIIYVFLPEQNDESKRLKEKDEIEKETDPKKIAEINSKITKKMVWELLWKIVLTPLWFLFFGWVLHFFL